MDPLLAGLLLFAIVGAMAAGFHLGQNRARLETTAQREPHVASPPPVAYVPARPVRPLAPLKPVAAPPIAVKAVATKPFDRLSLAAVRSWGYQLQNLDIGAAAGTSHDLLVIDPDTDGADATALTPSDIARLQRKPNGGRRLVLAYLSIGEAERYRSYWEQSWSRKRPSWLLGENPDWDENYAVCYWAPQWQGIICGSPKARIDQILAAGFDGVYLDKCDVYEDLRRHFNPIARSRTDLESDMVAFVQRISSYTKARDAKFLVLMQNAEKLLERADLRRAIDGAAKEELIFGATKSEQRNPSDDIAWSRRLLDLALRDGKPVFIVEYLADPVKITRATAEIRKLGYVPYIAPKDRQLASLNPPTRIA